MNFKLKALVAAAALIAAGSANAALVGGANGDGELFLNVVDTVTKTSFVFDLTNIGGNDFSVHSFEVGSAAAGQSYSWAVSGSSAWTSFITAAGSNALKWNVVATDGFVDYDNGQDNFVPGAEVVLSTINTSKTVADAATVGQLALDNAAGYDVQINGYVNAKSSAADPAVVLTAPAERFDTSLGGTFGGNLVESTNAVGSSATFVSLTGNNTNFSISSTAYAGAFKFDIVGGNAVLSYNVAVAAIPETDTYAMLLAGLGVMGFVARRRMAA